MSEIYLTDRSRYEAALTCKRLRYWAYEYKGRGLQRKALSVPLTVGIWTHLGLAFLLDPLNPERAALSEEAMVDEAVAEALAGYDLEVSDRGFSLDQTGDPTSPMSWIVAEQRSLIEANIRLFAQVGLKELLEDYEILEVEEDDLHMVSEFIGQMYQADAILRRRRTGGLVPLEFKTTWEWNEQVEEQQRIGNQGLAYIKPIESKYEEKIEAYKYIFLVKGSYGKWDSGSPVGAYGAKWYRNPLIHPYKEEGVASLGVESEYHVENLWSCTEPHKMKNGKVCPGPTESKSPRHYIDRDGIKRCNIWEEPIGVKGWIERLAKKQPEVLNAMVARPMNYVRDAVDVEDWNQQFSYQESTVKLNVAILNDSIDRRKTLNELFPMNRQSCWNYNSKCSFFPLCHDGVSAENMGEGQYQWREGHHQTERDRFEKIERDK